MMDLKFLLSYLIAMIVVGIEVWLPLLIGIITQNSWLIGIALTMEMIWQLPGTPFTIICIPVALFIKIKILKSKTGGWL